LRRQEAAGYFGDNESLRFVADGMLGKLARWLRMLGQDVEYSNNMDDAQLLKMAIQEKRILLTRDFELYQRSVGKGIESVYFEVESGEEQLAEVARRFGICLEIDMSTSRCPKCNTVVRRISVDQASVKVERNTLDHYREFWGCSKCGQVYWQGAHWLKIRKTLQNAREIVEDSKKEN